MPDVAAPRRAQRTLAAFAAGLLVASGGAALAHGGGGGAGHQKPHHRGAHGVVTAIDEPTFTVARGDESRTIVTDDDTRFAKTVDAALAEAGPGTFVGAHGRPADDGAVTARLVHIRPAPEPTGDRAADAKARPDRRHRRGAHVHGTVVSNDGSTLVVETPAGETRTVDTVDATRVLRTFRTDFDELAVDDRVRIFGSAGDDGTMAARSVHIVAAARPAPASKDRPDRSTTTMAAPASSADPTADPVALVEQTVDRATRPLRPSPEPRPGDRPHAAAGTVGRVAAPDFTLDDGRRTVVVSTTDDTGFWRTVDAGFADAAVGRTVRVAGERSGERTMNAHGVHILPDRDVPADHPGPHHKGGQISGVVRAADGTAGTLTVETAHGTVVVQTSDRTRFVETESGAFADLAPGRRAMAKGSATGHNALTAEHVHVDLTTAPGPRPAARPAPGERR